MKNPGRKLKKEAAKALCYVNGTGNRKIWERAIDKILAHLDYGEDETHDFLQQILAKHDLYKELESKFDRHNGWFAPPGEIEIKCPVWVCGDVKIYYYKEQYWAGNHAFPGLPMAMEHGLRKNGTSRSNSPLVQTGFLRK